MKNAESGGLAQIYRIRIFIFNKTPRDSSDHYSQTHRALRWESWCFPALAFQEPSCSVLPYPPLLRTVTFLDTL